MGTHCKPVPLPFCFYWGIFGGWNISGVMEQTQLNGDVPHKLGNATWGPNAQWKQNIKYYIIHKQQTYLYLGLPYTKNTGQINLDNVIYRIYKYPTMYKTRSRPNNINIKSQIDTIATITTPDFISSGLWHYKPQIYHSPQTR